jgi:large conductance mechanosensitive channel
MKTQAQEQAKAFLEFVRTQGVVGMAIGIILGGAVATLVKAFITDFVDPLLGLLLNHADGLATATFTVGGAVFRYGNFLNNLINFIVVAAVVYYGIKGLGLEKLDKKKE